MRAVAAEFVGTALLLAAVVGSGIMGERLAGGSPAIVLLANSVATGAALVALILTFAPISGAHFNPAVSIAAAIDGGLSWTEAGRHVLAQVSGALFGVAIANLMFAEPVLSISPTVRAGFPLAVGECVATFGLLVVIGGCSRQRAAAAPYAVGAYITAAYWFTSSTSFANPAATIARTTTSTFTGIRPVDVPVFVIAQAVGAAVAMLLLRWLVPAPLQRTVVPSTESEAWSSRV